MNEILDALSVLVRENCMTPEEALEKAYLAGHRTAVKKMEPNELVLVTSNGVLSPSKPNCG